MQVHTFKNIETRSAKPDPNMAGMNTLRIFDTISLITALLKESGMTSSAELEVPVIVFTRSGKLIVVHGKA